MSALNTVQLPLSRQQFLNARLLKLEAHPAAALWFPDSDSKSTWMRALDIPDVEDFLLQSGDYRLVMESFTGLTDLKNLPPRQPRLIYLLPRSIFSSKIAF